MTKSLPVCSTNVIYVVDDQKMIASTLSRILQLNGYNTRWFSEPQLLLDACVETAPALVVSDVMMPGMNGVELAEALRLSQPGCRILLFSGQANAIEEDFPSAAVHTYEVLAKPVRPDVLLGRIAQLLSSNASRRDPACLRKDGRRHSDISNAMEEIS